MHRVLWDPQKPGHPPVQGPLPGPGRLAGGAEHGDDGHRERDGQQRVGGSFGELQQARERQHQVSVLLQVQVLPNEAHGDYRRRKEHWLLSISRHLLATPHFNRDSSHFKTLHMKHQGSINVIMLLWLSFIPSFILFFGHLPALLCSESLFHACIWLEDHHSWKRCHMWHHFTQIWQMASTVLKFFFLLFGLHEYISECFYQAHFGPPLLLRYPGLVEGLFTSWWQVRPSVSAWLMTCCVAMQVINHTIIAKPHLKSQALGPWAAVSHIHHTGSGHRSVCHSRDCL